MKPFYKIFGAVFIILLSIDVFVMGMILFRKDFLP